MSCIRVANAFSLHLTLFKFFPSSEAVGKREPKTVPLDLTQKGAKKHIQPAT